MTKPVYALSEYELDIRIAFEAAEALSRRLNTVVAITKTLEVKPLHDIPETQRSCVVETIKPNQEIYQNGTYKKR